MRTFSIILPISRAEHEKIHVNKTYKELPLHCVIFPSFRIGLNSNKLSKIIKDASEGYFDVIELWPDRQGFFGKTGSKQGFSILKTLDLEELHWNFLDSLSPIADIDKESTGENFKPHIIINHNELRLGKRLVPSKIVLVEKVDDLFKVRYIAPLEQSEIVA